MKGEGKNGDCQGCLFCRNPSRWSKDCPHVELVNAVTAENLERREWKDGKDDGPCGDGSCGDCSEWNGAIDDRSWSHDGWNAVMGFWKEWSDWSWNESDQQSTSQSNAPPIAPQSSQKTEQVLLRMLPA